MLVRLNVFDWGFITQNIHINQKMKMFQDFLFSLFQECFPVKKKMVLSQNEPFMNDALLELKRKKSREYSKNRRSPKYIELEAIYRKKVSLSKKKFYRKKVSHLRTSNSRGWYRSLKELMKSGGRDEKPECEQIKHLSDIDQAEAIADSFAKISNEYKPIDRSKLQLPVLKEKDFLKISHKEVLDVLRDLKLNKSVPKNDVPAKIYKRFAEQLCGPLSVLINECIKQGCWPDFMKIESVTPVPKVNNPKTVDDLRKISGLLNISKILEKVIVKYLVNDIKGDLDKSQYANQEGQSINHYLVFMIDTVLKALDSSTGGQHNAVIASLIDWSKAFDRQDATLAVKSFQDNGVRPCLIPLLISFFEDRLMTVNWHNSKSSVKRLPGGAPQGASLGVWSFLSQTNDNPEDAEDDKIYKFVDDKSLLEVINLVNIGIASHNVRARVPSNIPVSNVFIPSENLKTQKHMHDIQRWTENKQMLLNVRKTKNMTFNFSKNLQFSTNIQLGNESVETVNEAKLLGTTITDNLSWSKNSSILVKQGNIRMQFLHKASKFTNNVRDLKQIYISQIRSKLEQSAVEWHSSLTKKNESDLERSTRDALRVILKDRNLSYSDALLTLKMKSLKDWREDLYLRFAKNCLKVEKLKTFFP